MSFDQRELERALKASSISIMGLVSGPERLILAAVTVSNRPSPAIQLARFSSSRRTRRRVFSSGSSERHMCSRNAALISDW